MTTAEILTELVGHYAYDQGATDSGVHDTTRKVELTKLWREAFNLESYRREAAEWNLCHWLSDEAIEQGYGMEDAVEFYQWLEDL